MGKPENPIEMAFRWHADDGPTLNAGFGTWISIVKKPYIFVIFQVVKTPSPKPPLDPPMELTFTESDHVPNNLG